MEDVTNSKTQAAYVGLIGHGRIRIRYYVCELTCGEH